jgi:hypothetical protein
VRSSWTALVDLPVWLTYSWSVVIRARSILAVLAAVSAGCAVVKPYQRERLASAAMESPFDDDRAAGEYKDKVQQAKTGGGLPGAAPGGGCGCTQ